ncbi:MAG: hypothetical protein WC626_05415 [Methanoregula sp.]
MIKRILVNQYAWLTIAWIFFCLFMIPSVSADNITSIQQSFPAYNETLHIANGQCVPLNSTVDISSLGWGVPYLSYYGRYESSFDPGNTIPRYRINLSSSAKILQNYKIDPEIFGDKLGFWYQDYNKDQKSGAGNHRMFYVDDTCKMPVMENGTELVNFTVINTTIPKPLQFLPEKSAGALLLARGDDIAFRAPDSVESNIWVFGRTDQIYDYKTKQDVVYFDADQFINFETGNYDAVIINKGNNSILEETYDPEYIPEKYSNVTWPAIISPFRNVNPINIHGMQPKLVEEKLINRLQESLDDQYIIWSISFQEPEIQIKRIDVLRNPDNRSWYNIRGYTNIKNGSVLTITIDADNLNDTIKGIRQWKTTAVGLDPYAWRQFNTIIPVDYEQIFPGYHYITITSETGATQTVPIYIMKELDPHYIPPEYTEYLGTSPFVTPRIIEKEVPVPGPTRIVMVHDTPTGEQLKQARLEADWEIIEIIVKVIAGILALILIGAWLYSAYRRAKA